MNDSLKKCKRCSKEKPIEEFKNKINCKSPIGTLCGECRPKRNLYNKKIYRKDYEVRYKEQVAKRVAILAAPVSEGFRRCHTCLNVKPDGEFFIAPNRTTRTKGGPSNYCAGCRDKRREYMAEARKRWTVEKRARILAQCKKIRNGRKQKVINHYGGKCFCCGETHLDFLTLDHINNDGTLDRKINNHQGHRVYDNVMKRGFPDTLRVACFNCNLGRQINGGICPHQLEKQAA